MRTETRTRHWEQHDEKKMPPADALHRRASGPGRHCGQQLVAGGPCSAKFGDALSCKVFGANKYRNQTNEKK